jgi:hypothetical protein
MSKSAVDNLIASIFPTPENHPWIDVLQPEFRQTSEDGKWDDMEWAYYLADCIKARASGSIGMLQVAFMLAVQAENMPGTRDVTDIAHQIGNMLGFFLEDLEIDVEA